MAEFTPEDVAVGDTVHLVYRDGDLVEIHYRGRVIQLNNGVVAVEGPDTRRRRWASLSEFEIVSVEKPKRELVTGGIYEVTGEDRELVIRRRRESGWALKGQPHARGQLWGDDETENWTIGRRVLLVDHPSERPGVAYDDLVTEAITREQA